MSLSLALAVLIAHPQAANFTVEPKLRTYGEMARLLSKADNKVDCDPAIANRLCSVSLKNHTLEESRTLVARGLRLRLRTMGEKVILEEYPETTAHNKKLFEAFIANFDSYHSRVFAQVRSIWPYDRLPTNEELDVLVQKNLGVSADLGWPGLRSKASHDLKAAVQLICTVTTNRFGPSTSAPTFFFFSNGGSIRRLIPADHFDEGNALQWEAWTNRPAWVRARAIAPVQASLGGADASINPEAADLVRDSRIVHRIRFDPIKNEVAYEFGVLGRAETLQGWYAVQATSPLSPPATDITLADIFAKAGLQAEHQARREKCKQVLESSKARVSGSRLSDALMQWDREFVAQISAVRDTKPQWVTDDGDFSIDESDGVLFIRNERDFIDAKYAAPAESYLKPIRSSEPMKLAQWAEWARAIKEKDNALVSRANLPEELLLLTEAHPFLCMLSAITPKLEQFEKRLAAGETVQIPLQDHSNACGSRFTASKRALFYATPPWTLRGTLNDILPVSPRYEGIVQSGILYLSSEPMESGKGRLLKFALRSGDLLLGTAALQHVQLGP